MTIHRVNRLTIIFFICLGVSAKKLSSQDLSSSASANQAQGKKQELKAKHVLGVFGANNQFPINLQGPSMLLLPDPTYGFTSFRYFSEIFLSYNLNLKKNYFLDAGIRYTTIFHGYETNQWLMFNGGELAAFQSAYRILSLNVGGGYRIVTNTGIKLFDFYGGATLGLLDNPVGAGNQELQIISYTDASNNSGVVFLNHGYRVVNRTFLGFYFGISKEIKITNNLYGAFTYLSHYGFSTLSEHNYNYFIPNLGIENSIKGRITPRSRMFAFGLRWHFIK